MKTLFTSNSGWVSFRPGEGGGLKISGHSSEAEKSSLDRLYCFVLRKHVWYRMDTKLVM